MLKASLLLLILMLVSIRLCSCCVLARDAGIRSVAGVFCCSWYSDVVRVLHGTFKCFPGVAGVPAVD
jgi:hypothetical protein